MTYTGVKVVTGSNPDNFEEEVNKWTDHGYVVASTKIIEGNFGSDRLPLLFVAVLLRKW